MVQGRREAVDEARDEWEALIQQARAAYVCVRIAGTKFPIPPASRVIKCNARNAGAR